MLSDYSKDALLNFLDYLKEKGLMKTGTVTPRKVAANKILEILDASEASDLRNLDIEDVMNRFANLSDGNYTPDSLKTYKSRLSSALDDFLRYKENPQTFKVGSGTRNRKKTANSNSTVEARESTLPSAPPRQDQYESHSISISTIDFPIPLRGTECIVQINGIPVDLNIQEAKKISNVILAMATSDEE